MEDDNSRNFNNTNNTVKLPTSKSTARSHGRPTSSQPREHDPRYMPMANITRVMRRALPLNTKISDDAKQAVQHCVSEFIIFITEEANNHCHTEHRKTVTDDDLISAMSRLGFDSYVEPLSNYLRKYRHSQGVEPHRPLRLHQHSGSNVVGPSHNTGVAFGASHDWTNTDTTGTIMLESQFMVPSQTIVGGPYYPTRNTRVEFESSHDSTGTDTGTMLEQQFIVPSQTMVSGPYYPTRNTRVGSVSSNDSSNTDTVTMLEHQLMVPSQAMIGGTYYPTHSTGVGFESSHDLTNTDTGTMLEQQFTVPSQTMVGGPYYPTRNTRVGFMSSHDSSNTETVTMLEHQLMVPSETMVDGTYYPTRSTGVGLGSTHDSTNTTTTNTNMVGYPVIMMGPGNHTTVDDGVGFGASHIGSTSIGTATPDYGLSPISNRYFDVGSSNSLVGFDDLLPFGTATSEDASKGGSCFDPFDDIK